tara:strand:- start:93 stop:746 length:654 start_codon:yes stop_codon:yes gene_type:complete
VKIENNSYLVSNLESMFAEDFNAPIFPILAKYYLDKSLINKALKVSEIGLEKNPNNNLGKYILSQIHILDNNLIKSEKLLISVVKYQPCNVKAIITLIKLKISLGRSKNIIKSYIHRAFACFPYNHEIQKLQKTYFSKNKKIKENKIKDYQTDNNKFKSIKIDAQLATKSLYNVFINQKKYIEAQQILYLMSKNKKHTNFILVENKKVLKLINKKGK